MLRTCPAGALDGTGIPSRHFIGSWCPQGMFSSQPFMAGRHHHE
jgi:hypothetical protein